MKKFFLYSSIFSVLLFTASVGYLAGMITAIAKEAPDLSSRRLVSQNSMIFASNGRMLAELHTEENRVIVPLKAMPKDLINAVLAIEDYRFYEHSGVDIKAILRALVKDIEQRKAVEGGSTITQQYIKILYFKPEKTIIRKIREAYMAWEIEKKYTKNQILQGYLNTIYFGYDAYGVEAASLRYFNKNVGKLTLAESALLAGLIRSPNRYCPFYNIKEAKRRRGVVLDRMVDQHFISSAAAAEAKKQPVRLATRDIKNNIISPYFVEYVKQLLIDKYGASMVFRGGLRVYTTIDLEMQQKAEGAIKKVLNEKGDPNASLVCLDPRNGFVKALVGGENFARQKFNLAVQGKRQPGSAFKPFVLATAINQKISPESCFASAPQEIHLKNRVWRVSNYGGSYRGYMNLRSATYWSDNSIYAQLIMKVGPENVVKMAHLLGIKSKLMPYPSIALGGVSFGVSPLEMASAFGTLANSGVRNEPVAITKIINAQGKLIYRFKKKPKPVISRRVSSAVNEILKGVIEQGTGTSASIDRPAAGKTGTTTDYRDAWFVGYTPYLSTSVWVGYRDKLISMDGVHGIRVAGGTLPAEIWAEFMRPVVDRYEPTDFPVYEMEYTKVFNEGYDAYYAAKRSRSSSRQTRKDGENSKNAQEKGTKGTGKTDTGKPPAGGKTNDDQTGGGTGGGGTGGGGTGGGGTGGGGTGGGGTGGGTQH